jgi:hypothetical protein
MDTQPPPPRTAKHLAESLANDLETLGNIYALRERYVKDPTQLVALRRIESQVFGELVQEILRTLAEPD